ncbi:protein FAM151B [Wyeomyia smithii]|uniref:protein FAM151B n=1 Tax=Wyeomyia smithii TaxID=174621 RepID=UPI002467C213|nr:protein FAM151B [Wyeomyia smithii]
MSEMLRILCGLIILGQFTATMESGKNLTCITWAHAVNSNELLSAVLQGDINFIEADIGLGYLDSDVENINLIPIMAHPPATKSDLSLRSFLEQVHEFNKLADANRVKGIKLDFKSIEAFEQSVQIIQSYYDTQRFTTWINADILPGPVNNTATVPVDPERFFQSVKLLSSVAISIGWTTKWGDDRNAGQYSDDDIKQMIDTIKENNVNLDITFPIRAGIAANSQVQLFALYSALNDTNNVTYTIWSSAGDAVNVEKLNRFIAEFGEDKIYVDVPDELKKQLNLNCSSKNIKNKC